MNCTACGHVNPAESSFCLECGRPLVPACAQCGTQLPPDAKFCNKCGAPTVESRLSKVESSHPTFDSSTLDSSTSPGERRQLTVLFCDLVGSTPLSQQLDAEEWRDP